MNTRDIVIGAVTGYNFQQIAPWVNSLDRSGFDGFKVVVAYNMSAETSDELTKRAYSVLAFNRDPTTKNFSYPKQNFSIVVERFIHYYHFLGALDESIKQNTRYVIATDVKDVIFQRNPSTFIDNLLKNSPAPHNSIITSSEGINYKDEAWGSNNLTEAFGPLMYERHKHNGIVNAGVFSASLDVFLAICKTVFLMCSGTSHNVPGGGGPDQAALNILLDNPILKEKTFHTTHYDTWAAQLGTTMDPSKLENFRPYLTEGLPKYDSDRELVVNPIGDPYTIVHQWDRVPEVRGMVERKYR